MTLPDDTDDEIELEDDESCGMCSGTGIGRYGDPDTSFCSYCDGGRRRPERDEDATYDEDR